MWESFGKLREQVNKLEQELSPAPLRPNGLRLIDPSNSNSDQDLNTQPVIEDTSKSAQVYQFKASNKRAH